MTKNTIARTILAALAATFGLGMTTMLTACNTVEGAGEDVSGVGRGVTEAADETQDAIFDE